MVSILIVIMIIFLLLLKLAIWFDSLMFVSPFWQREWFYKHCQGAYYTTDAAIFLAAIAFSFAVVVVITGRQIAVGEPAL